MKMMPIRSLTFLALVCSCSRPNPLWLPGPEGSSDTTETDGASSTSLLMATTDTESESGEGPDLSPWFGPWYHFSKQFTVNAPQDWANGGSTFGFEVFDLRPDGATIRLQYCTWGNNTFEYLWEIAEDGLIELQPVGGIHKFTPHGDILRLYVELGNDCETLFVRQLGMSNITVDFLTPKDNPLSRGELCLAQCAEGEGQQGIVSDCGIPVPWVCD